MKDPRTIMSRYIPLKPFEFKFRQIIYTGRNYEYMFPTHLVTFTKDLKVHQLWNDFTEIYTTHEDPPKMHEDWDLQRKEEIDQIITNGQILNLYLIKERYITIEYLKLISWGYSPLPPHYIITSQGETP
tara:strand:+ start:313 stop:699 length:387 start_codon:yes stop_codon:yes gene_type:complete